MSNKIISDSQYVLLTRSKNEFNDILKILKKIKYFKTHNLIGELLLNSSLQNECFLKSESIYEKENLLIDEKNTHKLLPLTTLVNIVYFINHSFSKICDEVNSKDVVNFLNRLTRRKRIFLPLIEISFIYFLENPTLLGSAGSTAINIYFFEITENEFITIDTPFKYQIEIRGSSKDSLYGWLKKTVVNSECFPNIIKSNLSKLFEQYYTLKNSSDKKGLYLQILDELTKALKNDYISYEATKNKPCTICGLPNTTHAINKRKLKHCANCHSLAIFISDYLEIQLETAIKYLNNNKTRVNFLKTILSKLKEKKNAGIKDQDNNEISFENTWYYQLQEYIEKLLPKIS